MTKPRQKQPLLTYLANQRSDLYDMFATASISAWVINTKAGAWGPTRGFAMIVENEASLDSWRTDTGLFACIDWTLGSVTGIGAEVAELALRKPDDCIAMVMCTETKKCVYGVVPKERDAMFPKDSNTEALFVHVVPDLRLPPLHYDEVVSSFTYCCAACGAAAPKERAMRKKCSRCRRVYYCNPNCQQAAWCTHRLMCAPQV